MSRKVVGIVVALLLATVGTVALVSYVRTAEQRAQAGEELVEVYVVNGTIKAGTSAAGTPGNRLDQGRAGTEEGSGGRQCAEYPGTRGQGCLS